MTLHSRDFSEQDFASPKSVLSRADSIMSKSKTMSAEVGGPERLLALELMVRASQEIDPDSIFAMPGKIGAMARSEQYAPARALMLLLKAQILEEIYERRRYRYDRVELPLEPLSPDISSWSGEQFKSEIARNVTAAVAQAQEISGVAIEAFADALSQLNDSINLTPTVDLFVYVDGARILKSIDAQEAAASLLEKALKAAPEKSVAWFYVQYLMHQTGDVESEIEYDEEIEDDTEDSWTAEMSPLERLYSECRNERDARIILQLISNNWSQVDAGSSAEKKEEFMRRVTWLRESLSSFPDWPGNETLMAVLSRLTRARVTVTCRDVITAGVEAQVEVSQLYTTQGGFNLYFWGDKKPDLYKRKSLSLTPVIKKRLDGPGANFPWKNDTVSLTLRESGYYIIEPYGANCQMPEVNELTVLQVVPWTTVMMSYCPRPFIAVMDGVTGAPVDRVTARGKVNNSMREIGLTDSKGLVKSNPRADYYDISLTKGGLRMDVDGSLRSRRYNGPSTDSYAAKVFVPRALYHPGDSVDWAIIVTKTPAGADGESKRSVAPDYKVILTFYDANYQAIDTIEGTTDAMGRLSGSFATRDAASLTGTYSIRVNGRDTNNYLGSASVTVSDFKTASFEVKIQGIERQSGGGLIIQGSATTYAGMPLADADVSVMLKAHESSLFRYFFWNAGPEKLIRTFSAKTDAAGRFNIEIPADTFKGEAKDSWYTAEVNVTSGAGESHAESRMFTLGKPYALSVSEINSTIDMSASTGLKFEVKAFVPGSDRNLEPMALVWELCEVSRPDVPLKTGKAKTDSKIEIPFDGNLDAGEYFISVMTEDGSLAPQTRSNPFTLYDSKRGLIPLTETMLFVPDSRILLDTQGRGEVLIGVACEQLWVYSLTQEGDKASEVEVRKLSRGFHRLSVNMSPGYEAAKRMMLFGSSKGESFEREIKFEMPPMPGIILKAESIRENCLPGTPESWKLRFERTDGTPLTGAGIATMYNRALDAIQTFAWPEGWSKLLLNNMGYLQLLRINTGSSTVWSKQIAYTLNYPELPSFNYVYPYSSGMLMSSNLRIAKRYAVATSNMMDCMAAPESIEEESADIETMTGAGADDSQSKDSRMEVREAEVLQGFWKPQLTVDNGALEIDFRMPQAIGAWTMKAFAWCKELESATFTHYAVSAKPVMIQPTMPRFVRQGDKVRLTATVYNNSDTIIAPEVCWNLKRSDGSELILKKETLAEIKTGESTVCSADIAVPCDSEAIDYTITVTSGDYTDGEHGVIPILEDAALVVESKVFYLPASATDAYELSVPNEQENFAYTLQYCQNPIWNLVRALRGSEWELGENTSSPVLASALFSRLAAMKIITENPGVGAIVRQWKENPSEKALESMLSRNEELKQLLLAATPWVSAAQCNTARMELLAEYLDRDKTNTAIAQALDKLRKLQQASGGFLWGAWSSQESMWCTESVLISLGIAESMQMIPDAYKQGVKAMTNKAIAWMDGRKELNEIKTDLMLTYMRSLYPLQTMSAEMSEIVTNTLADVQKHPTHYGVEGWAYAYLAAKSLHRSGAEGLIEKIRQHEVINNDTGISFPSVSDIRAYATIISALKEAGADATELDGLRQWVIVQTQAMDDIGAQNPDYVIASILMTGPVWTDAPVWNVVTCQGNPLDIGTDEAGGGYFSCQLPPVTGHELRLTIRPNGVTPSYGSLTAVGKRPADQVRERPGKDISISKRILVKRGTEWIEAEDLKVGDLVRIDLTLKLDRNMEYLVVTDARASAFEPVDQLPEMMNAGGLWAYHESRDATTNFFVDYAPRGTYHLAYEMRVVQAGNVSSGIATAQNQMAPELTAHSGGTRLNIAANKDVE